MAEVGDRLEFKSKVEEGKKTVYEITKIRPAYIGKGDMYMVQEDHPRHGKGKPKSMSPRKWSELKAEADRFIPAKRGGGSEKTERTYQQYVEDKKKRNEKPLSEKEWKIRVKKGSVSDRLEDLAAYLRSI